jgi:Zn-dependent protease
MNTSQQTERMKWSWKIATISGIGVYIHATFLFIIVWVIANHLALGQGISSALAGVLFTLALFGCVLLHELGHALAAKRYNIRTRDIILFPIGGVARLERLPEEPRQELWVALAGPAVNVVIAAIVFLWLAFTNTFQPVKELTVAGGSFMERFMIANVFLVLFNLIPAFPMDGGRVLRALLASRMEYTRATQIAAGTGQAFALLFGAVGLFTNPMLIFVALFIWIGASQESGMVQMRSSLGGIPVRQAMMTDFKILNAADPISRAMDLLIAGAQQDFPVVSEGQLRGVLTRKDLLAALGRTGRETSVADVMRADFCKVDSSDMLETALSTLGTSRCRTIPVLHHGSLVGLLTMENIGEFISIQAALGGEGGTTPGHRRWGRSLLAES